MTAQVLQFIELSDDDRKVAGRVGKLGEGDRIEVLIKRHGGDDQALSLPPEAASLIEALLGHLSQGERVAVLIEAQELSPNEAASILGVSRPLVVHRMDVGDLPFRYVGKHRRSTLRDVLRAKRPRNSPLLPAPRRRRQVPQKALHSNARARSIRADIRRSVEPARQ
jgi:hypothetical protein